MNSIVNVNVSMTNPEGDSRFKDVPMLEAKVNQAFHAIYNEVNREMETGRGHGRYRLKVALWSSPVTVGVWNKLSEIPKEFRAAFKYADGIKDCWMVATTDNHIRVIINRDYK